MFNNRPEFDSYVNRMTKHTRKSRCVHNELSVIGEHHRIEPRIGMYGHYMGECTSNVVVLQFETDF